MVLLVNLLLFIIILINFVNTNEIEFCLKDKESCENKYINNKRYILYDVNQSEGFNLRRDVYIRIGVFVKSLINHDHKYQWNLVLPPWSNLYHWKSNTIKQKQLPWSLFFDIESLNKYVKVIELYEFIEESNGADTVDKVFVLQNDPKMFETGDFKDKNKIVECNKVKLNRELFWGYNNITANEIICIEFHGTASQLVVNLNPSVDKSFMFDHMEIPLHDYYGSVDFWLARRSMRYNKELYEVANDFRKKYLNSTDKNDKTIRPPDWKDEKSKRNAVGGPYLAIHLRRGDFLTGRSDTVPTIKNAANQVIKQLKKLELKTVFVATDAEDFEYIELTKHLTGYNVYKYLPTEYQKNKFKDGGIAIIDQIISSHAKYFMGTYESTFTFRIQEDREILGLPIKSTFNTFCGKKKCPKSSQWTIIYE